MSERRADVQSRLATMNELDDVLGAMRGIAAARIQQGERAQVAARAYRAQIGTALARFTPTRAPSRAGSVAPNLAVAFGTDRGFVGALNERVLDAARATGATSLVIVGARGLAYAREHGISAVDGGNMSAHLGGLVDVADRVAALLARAADQAAGLLTAQVVSPRRTAGGGVEIVRRDLLPVDVDLSDLGHDLPAARFEPIMTLPRQELIADIAGEYVHARLYETAAESFVAANAASLEVLQAARSHMEDMLTALRRTENVLRQDEITAEVLELIAGRMVAS